MELKCPHISLKRLSVIMGMHLRYGLEYSEKCRCLWGEKIYYYTADHTLAECNMVQEVEVSGLCVYSTSG